MSCTTSCTDPHLAQLSPAVPLPFSQAVMRALNKEQAQRSTAAQLPVTRLRRISPKEFRLGRSSPVSGRRSRALAAERRLLRRLCRHRLLRRRLIGSHRSAAKASEIASFPIGAIALRAFPA